jgi:hypothetical protein
MTSIPLLWGTVATETSEFAQNVPLNLEPIILDNGIDKGQLRSTPGALPFGTGPGTDRGGINWNGTCYRVMGTKLVQVNPDGSVMTLGDVGTGGQVSMDYSFDRLAVASGGRLYYWNGTTLVQNVSINLGTVVDMLWIDGYFMTTDGKYVVVTELADPMTVKPLKYGSADEDPSSCVGIIKLRDEAYVCEKYTIQVFKNVGGNGFPFSTIKGATIPFGVVGTFAKTLFGDSFAFVGSARNEGLGVYTAGNATATKISTRALDKALAKVTDPSSIIMEKRVSNNEARLLIHLPTETWCYLQLASGMVGQMVWYRLQSGVGGQYRLRNAVNCYSKTLVGDLNSSQIGVLTDTVSTHFGQPAQWMLDLGLVYNEGRGGILRSIELVGLTGRGTTSSTIFLSLTRDGETYSMERGITVQQFDHEKRLQWRPQTRFNRFMGMRFRSNDGAVAGIAACEVKAVPLTV